MCTFYIQDITLLDPFMYQNDLLSSVLTSNRNTFLGINRILYSAKIFKNFEDDTNTDFYSSPEYSSLSFKLKKKKKCSIQFPHIHLTNHHITRSSIRMCGIQRRSELNGNDEGAHFMF